MADEQVVSYSGTGSEGVNEWGDGDDLQALIHAASDADARDNEEALIKEQEPTDQKPPESTIQTGSKYPLNHKKKDDQKIPKIQRSETSGYYQQQKYPSTDTGSRLLKCHLDDYESSCSSRLKINDESYIERTEGHANVVAAHYNTLKEKGLDERQKSRIFYMRNFNNWIKSMLINKYLCKVNLDMKHNSPIRVMDMCCGKGGDLLKWRIGNIAHLICTDIASVSLEQCESRYKEMCHRRNAGSVYSAQFIPADSTKVRLRERYINPSIKLNLVSCQFAFHYSFESLPQAECMLRNAAECLEAGGYLIGTIPDANDILVRQRRAKSRTFGNDVYQITFLCDPDSPPLFGAKYNFHLDGVVDCPEFLVHFPTFVKLARKFGLEFVRVERFNEFYYAMKSEGWGLLEKMQAFETFPPLDDTSLLGTAKDDYKHVEEFQEKSDNQQKEKIGTLSKSEWEAASLYLTFAFKKVKTTWDSKGKPQFIFD